MVSRELPHPEGTAVGRELLAWCEGVLALGHELQAWVWRRAPGYPEGPIPQWCTYEPFDCWLSPNWREMLYSVFKPHGGMARATWRPPDDHIVVAAEVTSSPAVVRFDRSVSTIHNRAALDGLATRILTRSTLQESRAEGRAARRAHLVLTYSERVARHLPGDPHVVPMGYPVPSTPLSPVEAPVAYLVADWSWAPNKVAISRLLKVWPSVREAVPGARLLLAGHLADRESIGPITGVKLLGKVGTSAEVMSMASVLAFPCPASTGPKVKVFEALAHGLPVVTTPWGVEGLVAQEGEGALVVQPKDFAKGLTELLLSPERRADVGGSGRAAVQKNHSPLAAARAHLNAFATTFGP